MMLTVGDSWSDRLRRRPGFELARVPCHGRVSIRAAEAAQRREALAIPRVYVEGQLAEGAVLRLGSDRAHYLLRVLRLAADAELALFNGRDGEWRARLTVAGRRDVEVEVQERTRAPEPEPGPVLAFAPLRPSRMDWLVEKAVELGASALVPILTRRTVVRIDKAARLQSIAAEAAEQCGRLQVPPIAGPAPFPVWLTSRDAAMPLLVADPGAHAVPFLEATRGLTRCEILIGPEGGLDEGERGAALARGGVPVSLGPRVLRAETAALAALAAWQVAADRPGIR